MGSVNGEVHDVARRGHPRSAAMRSHNPLGSGSKSCRWPMHLRCASASRDSADTSRGALDRLGLFGEPRRVHKPEQALDLFVPQFDVHDLSLRSPEEPYPAQTVAYPALHGASAVRAGRPPLCTCGRGIGQFDGRSLSSGAQPWLATWSATARSQTSCSGRSCTRRRRASPPRACRAVRDRPVNGLSVALASRRSALTPIGIEAVRLVPQRRNTSWYVLGVTTVAGDPSASANTAPVAA